MYLLHMTEGVDKYRQSMNQGTTDERDDVFHNMIVAAIGVGVVMIGRKLLGESE